MNDQTALAFEIAEPEIKTLLDMVRQLLSDKRWWTPWEICEEIWRTRSVRISDSTACARLRDLRKARYGSHTISIRKRAGSRAFEYRMEA